MGDKQSQTGVYSFHAFTTTWVRRRVRPPTFGRSCVPFVLTAPSRHQATWLVFSSCSVARAGLSCVGWRWPDPRGCVDMCGGAHGGVAGWLAGCGLCQCSV